MRRLVPRQATFARFERREAKDPGQAERLWRLTPVSATWADAIRVPVPGLNDPDLTCDPRFATNADRAAHVDELAGLLAESLRGRTARQTGSGTSRRWACPAAR